MLWVGVAVACIAAVVLWGPIVSTVEQARYTVTKTQGAIEVRDYAPMIVAETDVPGGTQTGDQPGLPHHRRLYFRQ